MAPPTGIESDSATGGRAWSVNDKVARTADRARLADVEAQILKLENSLRLLRQEGDVLRDRLAYPVLTLPNEIVSEIFLHFLPVYPKRPPMLGRLSPTTLCQICRIWRDIAMSTPTLWRAIALSLGSEPREHQLRLLEAYLERSGSCLLSVKLTFSPGGDGAGSFVQAIASHSARWEHLWLSSPDFYLDDIKGPLPFLRSAKIDFWQIEDDSTLIPTFHSAPLLHNVNLMKRYVDCYGPILPWSQLTAFTVDWILPRQCIEILNQVVNLVHCNVRIFDARSSEPQSLNIVLPRLESLVLSTASPPRWSFLDILTLPALRRLQVTEVLLRPDPVATLASLVSRSNCELQELCVFHACVPHHPYQKALPSVGSLRFISNGEPDIDDVFFPEWDEERSESFSDTESNLDDEGEE
ncbi:hypothetical protein C8R44DRAFT_775411 [Mycena epipterygia]|nr:hypothetical protein C8R44DRAFT_775411 [Mycena epipterygia]